MLAILKVDLSMCVRVRVLCSGWMSFLVGVVWETKGTPPRTSPVFLDVSIWGPKGSGMNASFHGVFGNYLGRSA